MLLSRVLLSAKINARSKDLWICSRPVTDMASLHAQDTSVGLHDAVKNCTTEHVKREGKMYGDCDLDPEAFTRLKAYTYRDHTAALESVGFCTPASEESQHLDVGCGPGNFLSDCLLPRLRPYRRVLAIDKSRDMLQHARQCCREKNVCFERHDIEHDNPNLILDKYGPFDRVFAFLTFHFVSNLKKGYANVNRLLKDGGECLTVNFTRTGITDVLYRLHQKREWRACVPDLTAIFADRFCFDRPVPKKQLIGLEKSAVTDAGLHLISCNTYKSQWIFPNMEECSDLYVPLFKLGDNVPKEKQSDFWDAFKSTVLEVSGTAEHITFDYDSIVTHSQKRGYLS